MIEVVERPRRKRSNASKSPAKAKKKPKSISRLKRDLDSIFSLYIRTLYSKDGMCTCYTCGKVVPLKKAHCGHFISRVYLATRWDVRNCRVQEAGCNIFGNGMFLEFEERLTQELGAEVVSELKQKRKEVLKLSRGWYEAEIARFQALLEGLGIK